MRECIWRVARVVVGTEWARHSDPLDLDSDDDGFGDGFERQSGKSPTDAVDHPVAYMTIKPAAELGISTKLGVRYGVQYSNDLQN